MSIFLKNEVLPKDREFIDLHEPLFNGNEWLYVKDCLDTGWVASVGQYVVRFDQQLADNTGAKYAVAVVNGTAALHIYLQMVGVSAGDEVIMPALTFVATANGVSYCGSIPHFVDSELRSIHYFNIVSNIWDAFQTVPLLPDCRRHSCGS